MKKRYHFMAYVRPDKPIKYSPIEASCLADAWQGFLKANSQASQIIKGGQSAKEATINFEGLMGRIWPRRVVIFKIEN